MQLVERVRGILERSVSSGTDVERELASIVAETKKHGRCSRDYQSVHEMLHDRAPEFEGDRNWRPRFMQFCDAFDIVFVESGDGSRIDFMDCEMPLSDGGY